MNSRPTPNESAMGTSQCLISFGSNLGERHELVADAARRIAAASIVSGGGFEASRLFETPPIGGPGGQSPFLNAVAAFETQASAQDVLDLLQSVENQLGRQRRRRWGARSIDLDVVLHGRLVGGALGLTVPHPRYTARQFVLQPACDVASHYRDPRFGWSLKTLAAHVSAGSPSLSLVGGDAETRKLLCQRIREEHGIRVFGENPIALSIEVRGNVPAQVNVRGDAGDVGSQDGEPIEVAPGQPWVSAYVPPLPKLDDGVQTGSHLVPRLVARIERTSPETAWPAPHQIWSGGWRWPEYRLEVSDLDWAVSEIASALDSMRCPLSPVTSNGQWWQ